MRKEVVIVGMKTNEEADEAVLEIDSAVRESTAAVDAGKVREYCNLKEEVYLCTGE